MSSKKDTLKAMKDFLEAIGRGEDPNRKTFLARHRRNRTTLREHLDRRETMEPYFREARAALGIRRARLKPGPFGEYEILQRIGGGGMGEVYLARSRNGDNQVALKVMLDGAHASEEDVFRFKLEARAISSLDHPNIVRVHGFEMCEGQRYITMDLVRGGSLDEHLPTVREDIRQCVAIMVKVARAIQYAHERGILHRDLKPGNILLNEYGDPVIVDWGLAKHVAGGDTITGKYARFTAEYAAPEQGIPQDKRLTTAVDVYSLGVLLYEFLTGRVPFRGGDPIGIMVQKSRNDPPLPRNVEPEVDSTLELICLKCLRIEPGARYESAGKLADDLESWLEGRRVDVDPPRVPWKAIRNVAIQREVRRDLIFISRAVADRVLMKLKDWGHAVVEAANDPGMVLQLKRGNRAALRRYLAEVRKKFDDPARGLVEPDEPSPFESWFILDRRGTMMGYPDARRIEGEDFSGREWFRRAFEQAGRRGQESIHVSRLFRSVVKPDRFKFTLSMPVHDGNGPDAPALGVIGASFTTDSDMGIQRLNDDTYKVVVAGRADPKSPGGYSPDDYLVLMHPGFTKGQEAVKVVSAEVRGFTPNPQKSELRSPDPGQFGDVDQQYEDPLGTRIPSFKGPWWAGVAPVGNTNLVAIVQRRPPGFVKAAPGSEIVVGHLSDRNGLTASVAEPYARGIVAYTDWVNAEGGINGKRIRLVDVDYRGRIRDALQVYAQLKSHDRIVAIQGWGTGDSEVLSREVRRDRIPYLSASCSARLANPVTSPYNFITMVDYTTQLRAGLKFLRSTWEKSRKPRVAFVHPDTPYGTSPFPGGMQYARRLGYEIVGSEIVGLKSGSAAGQVRRLKKLKPDFTWIGGTTPSTAIILKDAKRMGLRTRFLVSLWGNDEELFGLAGKAAEGIYGIQATALLSEDVRGMQVIREFAKGEATTSHFVRGWVSMQVLCEAIRRADTRGELTGPGVKNALETLRNFDTRGLTPPITFTPRDHRPNMDVRIYRFSRGEMRHVETISMKR